MLQIDGRLEEILETTSYFVDRSQDVLEILTARMARLESNEENPAKLPSKDKQALKRDYNLIEFAINTAEDFKKAVKKTKGAYAEFFRRVLITYNWCQVEAKQRLDDFPNHNSFIDMLQKRHQEEEARVQHIKAIDDQMLRSEVGHSAVSVQLLEDQLRLSAARVEAIKNQAEKFEINIQFLDPVHLRAFPLKPRNGRNSLTPKWGPLHKGVVIIVICNFFL